jgi:flagellar biosynthetic protein FliR
MESYATAQQVFAASLVFVRLASIVMLIPGIGESYVPPRIRLSFAFAFALMMMPVLAPQAPPLPASAGLLFGAVIQEVLIGLMIGAILRIFMTSMSTAGELISLGTTLSFAQTANPSQAQPTAALGSFLSILALVLIMATDLHHMFLAAIVNSFSLFPFHRDVPVADSGVLAVQTLSKSFALGFQLSAPVLVFSLIINIAAGLIGRVMPQFQIFFVVAPLQVIFGLSLLALGLGVIGTVWVDAYREHLTAFTG